MSDNKSESKRQNIIVIVSICIVLAVAIIVTVLWSASRRATVPPETETDAPTESATSDQTEPPETKPTPGSEYAAVAGSELWDKYLARLVMSSGGELPSGIIEPKADDEAAWLLEKFYSPAAKTFSDGVISFSAEGDGITVKDASGELKYTGANDYDRSVHYVKTDGEEIGRYVTVKDMNITGGKLLIVRQLDRVVRVPLTEGAAKILNNAAETSHVVTPDTVADTSESSMNTAAATVPVTESKTDTSGIGTEDETNAETEPETERIYTSADTVTVVQSYTYVEFYTVTDGIPELFSTHIIAGAYDGFDYNADSSSYRFYCDYDVFGGDMTAPEQYIPFYVTPEGERRVFEPERIQPADAAAIEATYAGADVVSVVRIKSDGTVDDYMAVYQIGYTSPAIAIEAGE